MTGRLEVASPRPHPLHSLQRPLWQTPSPDVKVALHSAGACVSLYALLLRGQIWPGSSLWVEFIASKCSERTAFSRQLPTSQTFKSGQCELRNSRVHYCRLCVAEATVCGLPSLIKSCFFYLKTQLFFFGKTTKENGINYLKYCVFIPYCE